MNESTSASYVPVPESAVSGIRSKLSRFYWPNLFAPLLGAMPGVFLLWIVIGPVLHSHKLTAPELMNLGFIAAGIAWFGVLLGAILACVSFIARKAEGK